MKILAALFVLSTLSFSQAEHTCKKTTDWTNPASITFEAEDEKCTEGVEQCVRPKWDGTKYTTLDNGNVKWGCGDCTSKKDCVQCDAKNCNVAPVFKCLKDKDGAETDAACPEVDGASADAYSVAPTKCYRPKVVGMNMKYSDDGAAWGCKTCGKPENCKECTGAKCNVAPTEKKKCLNYKKTGDVWAKNEEEGKIEVDCSTDMEGVCKMPTPDNAAATWDPCGPCPTADNNKICKQCNDAEKCNDIAGARYCKKGAAAATAAAAKSEFCADKTSNCERPFISYGKAVADASGYGCGDCAEKDATKCVKCGTAASDCNKVIKSDVKVSCMAWSKSGDKWTVGAKKECVQNDDTNAKCSRPASIKVLTEGYAGDGCGPCGDGKDCQEFGADQNVAGSHSCYKWSWSTDKYVVTANAQQCDKASDKKCNMPKDASKKDAYSGDGCASCKENEAGCLTTEVEKNNWGHRATISLLAVVLPLLYTML